MEFFWKLIKLEKEVIRSGSDCFQWKWKLLEVANLEVRKHCYSYRQDMSSDSPLRRFAEQLVSSFCYFHFHSVFNFGFRMHMVIPARGNWKHL